MHVRLMPTVGLVLALSSACALHAQSNVHFGVSGGVALPIGDLGNAANVGFDLGARVTVPLSSPSWGLRGDLNWNRFGGKAGVNSYSYLSIAGNLVHREPGARLYEFFGPGVYNQKIDFTNGFNTSRTDLGLQGGVGLDLNASDLKTFVEFGLTSVFSSGSNSVWFPVRFGIRF